MPSSENRDKIWPTFLVFLLALTAVIGSVYLIFKKYGADELYAIFPKELAPAQIEKIIQNLPEEKPAENALKIPIFIYHSIRPHIPTESKNQDAYDITPELFEEQLSYLKNNEYSAISLDELAHEIEDGKAPPKQVILTFDDGWHNQYKYAFPLLKKYNMIGVFFIYTNPIGKKHFLTWDEIKEMSAAGMTIGDHTLSHPYLKTISMDAIKKEITNSKKIIEDNIGKPVLHFASPFGYTNEKIMTLVKEAGYETARTTHKGIYHSKNDILRLTGILVSDNFDDFVAVLNR